jgi:hypothetical protein
MPCYLPHPYGPYNSLLSFPSPRSFPYADSYPSELEQVIRNIAALEREFEEVKKTYDEYKKKLRDLRGRIAEAQRYKTMLGSGHQVGLDFY